MVKIPVQFLMLFVGAYVALNAMAKLSPLDKIATVCAGIFALVIWLARYNRALLYSLSLKPGIGPAIGFICKIAKEQPPVDPSMDAPAGQTEAGNNKAPEAEAVKLQLHSDADFASATRYLKDVIRGHNDVLEVLIDQLRRNVQLRESSSSQVSLPPLGIFVLVGKPGPGKKSLAVEIGYRLYKGSSVLIAEGSDPGLTGSYLVGEARANPFSTFVVENFQSSSKQFQEDLLSIVAGAPQVDSKTGSKVSFRHCFFFLLVHKDAEGMERPVRGRGGTGHTMVVDSLNAAMPIDKRLSWSLHGIYPFVMPAPLLQAEVVAQAIQNECKKYNVMVGHIAPAILAREVQVISTYGSFEITPSRVAKILNDRLLAAAAAKEQLIDVEDNAVRADSSVRSSAGR